MPRSVILVLLLTAGCAATPPAIDPARLPSPPERFKEREGQWTEAQPAAAQPRGEWWKAFGDPVLDELIARAEKSNASLQVAAANVTRARAILRAADAALLPRIDADASGARVRGIVNGTPGPARNLFAASADLSYEVDLFGRLAGASRAAALDAQASEALLLSTRLLVQAEVARTYLALRALDAERVLVRATVRTYRDTLDLTERRWRAGDVAELDVTRVMAEMASTESETLALDRRRAELEHALAVLLGEAPSDFSLPPGEWRTELPVIPAGVPATVLARRPDVSAAMREMLAAQARVGVAKAAWFPSIALTATGGYASPDISDLFKWSSRAWGIGLFGALPIFDGGRREAGVQAASADLDAAIARYREQVLVAVKDVEDALSALRLLAEQSEAQARAVKAASRSTALSAVRYRTGYVSQLDLLDALRSELRNRREALQVRAARHQATVALVRALGGSWEP
ncbi:MAG TPA: efflux transporter outer membrane subunit [Burkholderiales bacterium]